MQMATFELTEWFQSYFKWHKGHLRIENLHLTAVYLNHDKL